MITSRERLITLRIVNCPKCGDPVPIDTIQLTQGIRGCKKCRTQDKGVIL